MTTQQALPTFPPLSPNAASDILACMIYAHLENRGTPGVFQDVLSRTMIANGLHPIVIPETPDSSKVIRLPEINPLPRVTEEQHPQPTTLKIQHPQQASVALNHTQPPPVELTAPEPTETALLEPTHPPKHEAINNQICTKEILLPICPCLNLLHKPISKPRQGYSPPLPNIPSTTLRPPLLSPSPTNERPCPSEPKTKTLTWIP